MTCICRKNSIHCYSGYAKDLPALYLLISALNYDSDESEVSHHGRT